MARVQGGGGFGRSAPASAPGFIVAQLVGAAIAVICAVALYPDVAGAADDVIVPHTHPQQEKEHLP